ncbi:MAG: SDR family oxidoreductase [Candidatus Chisholmbacteria bacterium]|nr:SDR family oxidoreductase [Candidatus Chisholmbacteria bacterium]
MKFALVTGASTGIGQAVAVELGGKGYTVGLVARRKEKLEETKRLVEEVGGKAEVFVCDLADVSQVNGLIQEVKRWTNHLDVLVNVAGIWHGDGEVYAGKDFGTFDQKVILDTYAVGFTAPTLLVHGLLPIMGDGSAIINLSGTFENGARGWLPYFASKRALEDFTLGLAEELKDKGIRVNCVSPSDTATEEYRKYFPEDARDANSVEDVARLIVELAEGEEGGKFVVIKKGVISEGFHS